ncbi:MAG TPA: aminotransferase class V-fold PLP-dependent enzyme [Crenotrichaceae bacterium]|nr:aminotransferase class V-fold PLP-dependent enzyme [Crenotrichaceae bacterium]
MQQHKHLEFPHDDTITYLNHAAVAPLPLRTGQAITKFANENVERGSQHYPAWLKTEQHLHHQLQQLLNAPSVDDIALVKNTSEALSMVAYGIQWQTGDNIVSSNQEFPSNRIVWQSLSRFGVSFREADFASSSTPEQALFDCVDRHTRMITISSVQFSSGIRLDLEVIGAFCKQRGILFCIDAIQSLGVLRFDVQACQADFVMADGHKWMLGPEGLGVFYTSATVRDQLQLTQYGWHMIEQCGNYDNTPWVIAKSARRFECGSSNMLGIHALSASLSLLLETGIVQVEQAAMECACYLRKRIESHHNTDLVVTGDEQLQSPIVVFRHRTIDTKQLYRHLQEEGVICAPRGGGIRFSPHFYHTREQLDRALSFVLV